MKLTNYLKMYKIKKFFFLYLLILLSFSNIAYSEILKEIIVDGNERVSSQTIILFSNVSINESLSTEDLNTILKEINSTGFFKDVKVQFYNGILKLSVIENPIIQNITVDGIKSQKILDDIFKNLELKERSSFNENILLNDKNKIVKILNNLGFYFAKIETFKEELEDNKVDINFKINLGSKAKIKKISFIGNKIFKDNQLKRIIISEEYRFWKFISGRKFLNKEVVDIDIRLIKNFFLNRGYYNVKVNSSFAKLLNEDSFDLIFNIDAGQKIYFNNLTLNIPDDFERQNFEQLENIFISIKDNPYSLYDIEKILDKIDQITLTQEYKSINATLNEEIIDNKINIAFNIEKSQDNYVEVINIYGNNVTRESVIRNRLLIDEGDPYNEILKNKTLNNIKNLNFFKSVDIKVSENINKNSKIIDIIVEEKPTGEIAATAGIGSGGNSIGFSVKENNFLGKGIGLDSILNISVDSIKGSLSVNNPNFMNTDKSVNFNIESTELNKFADFGYKTNKTGLSIFTKFEYLDDFWFGIGLSNYYQNIETDSTASELQKKQRGDYFDSYLKLDFDFDKRNQKFQTNSGFRSFYSVDLPMLSKTYSLVNSYDYKFYTELYPNNVTSFSVYLKTVNSINGNDIKLSERVYIPYNKLRGFKNDSVGPKDGADFIGGNYASAVNIISTLPKLLENSQNTDFSLFLDIANNWGVDYNSSINNSNEIRSSIGIALDWLTPVGPLNFSLAQPITKENTDKTENFRFNLGTTF